MPNVIATLPKAVRRLTESFERLPGIGPKSAQRLVFYLLHNPESQLTQFAENILALKRETVLCSQCHHISEQDPCPFCSDPGRDQTVICLVEQPLDVIALEQSGAYQGRYHVLHGSIQPLNNVGPDQLFLRDIKTRLAGVKELILATNPTMEGEATALYIVEYVKSMLAESEWPQFTRLGRGLPTGADIEYADGLTLKRSLEGRQALSS